MRRNSFNDPRSKKYRPTKKEQGIYTVRQIGDPIPQAISPEVLALEAEAALLWAKTPANPTGIQKRNLRSRDIGKKTLKERLSA